YAERDEMTRQMLRRRDRRLVWWCEAAARKISRDRSGPGGRSWLGGLGHRERTSPQVIRWLSSPFFRRRDGRPVTRIFRVGRGLRTLSCPPASFALWQGVRQKANRVFVKLLGD